MKIKLFTVWLLFMAGILYSAGEKTTDKTVLLRKRKGNIKIDGKLDDAGWRGRMAAGKFYKSKKLGLPEFQTEVYITWDDENLYVGAKLHDEDIVANYSRRDDPIYNEDVFEIFIRPDLTKNFIFEFEFSPTCIIFDALDKRTPNNSSGYRVVTKKAWNAEGIECAVHIEGTLNDWSDKDKYWSVEIKLPLKNMTYRKISSMPRKESVWGMVFSRCESSLYLKAAEYSASIALDQYGVWEHYTEWKAFRFE